MSMEDEKERARRVLEDCLKRLLDWVPTFVPGRRLGSKERAYQQVDGFSKTRLARAFGPICDTHFIGSIA